MVNKKPFRVGFTFPQTEIGTDAIGIRDFAQGVEELGYDYLVAYDHIVGADLSNRPDWDMPYHLDSMFHEPLTLFSYLAGVTSEIRLMPGVIILPQRQTVLFAKQAANTDVFCGGRLEVGVGLGWNDIEYHALGMPFEKLGKTLDEQIALLRRLWTERSITDAGDHHDIREAGIYPLPVQQPIPIWIGGSGKAAMLRAAASGDGWFPFLPSSEAERTIDTFRQALTEANRKTESVPLEILIFFAFYKTPVRTLSNVIEEVEIWRRAGAQGACIDSMGMGLSGAEQHLDIAREVAESLGLAAG